MQIIPFFCEQLFLLSSQLVQHKITPIQTAAIPPTHQPAHQEDPHCAEKNKTLQWRKAQSAIPNHKKNKKYTWIQNKLYIKKKKQKI